MDPSQVELALPPQSSLCGDAVEGQVSFHGQLSVRDDADALGLEIQVRELFDIEEIGDLQVGVARTQRESP